MSEQTPSFEQWAIVEVMGHHSYAGKVTKFTLAGSGFIRVDVPEVSGHRRTGWDYDKQEEKTEAFTRPSFTKLVSPSSIYAITPVAEDVARAAAERTSDPLNVYVPALRESLATVARLTADCNDDELDEDLDAVFP